METVSRTLRSTLLLFVFFIFSCSKSPDQPPPATGPQVKTLAGKAVPALVDGFGDKVGFNYPIGITMDPSGNIFIADQRNNAIRKMDALGNVVTFAGSQQEGLVNGAGSVARFYHPTAIASDGSGNLFVTDYQNDIIRKISPSGIVSTYAGLGPYGIGFFLSPSGIAVGGNGNIFVADYNRHKIYKIDPTGIITDYAGDGVGLHQDGIGTSARFVSPNGIAMDVAGNIYVADAEGHRIRKIAPDLKVTTVAGSGEAGYADGEAGVAKFKLPQHVAIDGQGNILVTDYGNNRIRKISKSGIVSTLAGNGNNGLKDGSAAEAEFSNPLGITIAPDGKVYVVDNGTNRIRVIIP